METKNGAGRQGLLELRYLSVALLETALVLMLALRASTIGNLILPTCFHMHKKARVMGAMRNVMAMAWLSLKNVSKKSRVYSK